VSEAVIVAALRTPMGRYGGVLAPVRPDDLGAHAMRALVDRVGFDPALVDDVFWGAANQAGEDCRNAARMALLLAGLPTSVPGTTVNRLCGSGLQAINSAYHAIAAGVNDIVIAGGLESMSMVPMTGNKLSMSPEAMDRFPDVYTPMGITAENVAKRFSISREDQDKFALWSQKKASAAIEAGRFKEEIVPVQGVRYKGNEHVSFTFDRDELPRPDTTAEGLAGLKPSFSVTGSVTPGNASPLSDGAAAAIITSKETADKLGVKPLGYFRQFVSAGVDPSIMGIGPIPAVQKLLAKTGLTIADIDLFEMNEAFASQAIYCQRTLGIPDEKLNVNGGAIALGHPLGCTGAKLVATALYELKRRNQRRAIVTMCIGGGMGAAGLLERV